jgi:transposase
MIAEAIDYKAKYEEASFQVIQLRHELDQLKRLVFGSRHERFVPSTPEEQLSLALDLQKAETPAPVIQTITYNRKQDQHSESNKPHQGRMPLPASLPREEMVIEPKEDVTGLKKIGEEITEELEATEMKFFVRRIVRPKYAKVQGDGVLIGTLPSRPIEKGIAGPGLLSMIMTGKFIDHLPIYRQIDMFKRAGIIIPSSTIGDWIKGSCNAISPLFELHQQKVLESTYLMVDESPIKVLDKNKKGTTHRGFHWVYYNPDEKLVLFDYREGRGREGPEEMLKNFKGYLQTDGYQVYESFSKKHDIIHLQCMAHARRKFDEALSNHKVLSEYALTEIQKLYAIEQRIREQGLNADLAKELRQNESVPLLTGFKSWLLENYNQVTPQSPIGKAISYSLQRWDKLSIYATDGRLRIDNNFVENAIRPLAIGRKNYLFAGSHDGARRAAMLYSFMATCKKQEINPQEWLKDVLGKIADWPQKRLHELLPQNWKNKSE